jgi:hypothetical protein
MLTLLDSESFPIWSQGVPMSQDQNLGAPLIRVDFDPGFGCSSILGVYQLEVGLDLLIWRILSSVSSDAYLEHYP